MRTEKLLENSPVPPVQEEAKKEISKYGRTIIMEGYLRKKGIFFWNERLVRITDDGVLSYYDAAKPQQAKKQMNLKHVSTGVKIVYAGRPYPANSNY